MKDYRPRTWDEFIGNIRNVKIIRAVIDAAIIEYRPLSHILMHGYPGTGKTTMAMLIADEFLSSGLDINFFAVSGAILATPEIFSQSILAKLKFNKYNIVFIDEVDALESRVMKLMLTWLEGINVTIQDQGDDYPLEQFKLTVIAACNSIGKLSHAFIRRFPVLIHMDEYSYKDMLKILIQASSSVNLKLDKDALIYITERSRKTPSFVINILRNIRDFVISDNKRVVSEIFKITGKYILEKLKLLGISDNGLYPEEVRILNYLKFIKRPIGAKALCDANQVDLITYQHIYEPFLLRNRYIIITNKGREIV